MVGRYGTQKTRSQDSARGFRNTVSPEYAPASAFSVIRLRKTDEKARKYTMFAEKMVQKAKPTEACGRRIAQGGLIVMFAQTSV